MTIDEKQELLKLMDHLISTLDGLQDDASLRQIWLETQWLKQNLQSDKVIVPTNWKLLIFRPPSTLLRYPDAAKAAIKLANALSKFVARKKSVPDGNR